MRAMMAKKFAYLILNDQLMKLKHYKVWNVLFTQVGGTASIKFVTKKIKSQTDFPLIELYKDFQADIRTFWGWGQHLIKGTRPMWQHLHRRRDAGKVAIG